MGVAIGGGDDVGCDGGSLAGGTGNRRGSLEVNVATLGADCSSGDVGEVTSGTGTSSSVVSPNFESTAG